MAKQYGTVSRSHRSVAIASASIAIGFAALSATGATAHAATPSDAPAVCTVDGSDASVHYVVRNATNSNAAAISGISITGLVVSECADPLPATLTIKGTPSGDPSVEPTETLTSLDSTRDPCTGQKLPQPSFVTNGAISWTACPTGGPGGYANVHDATRLILQVAAQAISLGPPAKGTATNGPGSTAVLGEKVTKNPDRGGTGNSALHEITDRLPFTGSPVERLVAAGLILVLMGGALLLVVRSRRRRRVANYLRP